jgi:hypothetical protein
MRKNIVFLLVLGIFFTIAFSLFDLVKGGGDIIAYWSASHIFISGGNPYNQSEMGALQQITSPERFTNNSELINSWNPPWIILLLLPIGILPFSVASLVWIFINVFLIGSSLIITWRLCVGDKQSKGIIYVFLSSFLFVETISYLAIGQITSLVLLGIILVIWLINHELDFLAGMALLITTIKPHISFFFIILVFIWVIKKHRWKVLVGFISLALFSMGFFWLINPGWLNDYIHLLLILPYNQLYTSTVGSFTSENFNISIFKYSAILLIFLIKPLYEIIEKEGWLTTTNIALLSSLSLAPYGFNFDQIVLLPTIVQLIAWITTHELPKKSIIFVIVSLVLMDFLIIYMISIPGLENYWFFWIPIVMLGIYLITWKTRYVSTEILC